ncbi:hypothetical protein L204_105067 [Cryptococcus depauperatus]|nr:hypothetical protein L204_03715 [Cryptococcus depauperatus CBS 7855]
MLDTALSPRIHNLLIRDEATGPSLPPLQTRPRMASRRSTDCMLPPLPLSPQGKFESSPVFPASPLSPSTRSFSSPTLASFSLLTTPLANKKTNSIRSLLNGPSSSQSATHHALRDQATAKRLHPIHRPQPTTFPMADIDESTYIVERSYLPLTQESAYHPSRRYHSYSTHPSGYYPPPMDRPAPYRRHPSHPYERYPVYSSFHPPAQLHSAPYASPASRHEIQPVPVQPTTAFATVSYDPGPPLATSSRPPISRTTKACNSCRARKVRCDAGTTQEKSTRGMPCSRCRENKMECIYTNVQKKRGPCPGTARPLNGKSRRTSTQKQTQNQFQDHSNGIDVDYSPQISLRRSHRSSVASVQANQGIVTPEESDWTHTSQGYDLLPPSVTARNGGRQASMGYDWQAVNGGMSKPVSSVRGWPAGTKES